MPTLQTPSSDDPVDGLTSTEAVDAPIAEATAPSAAPEAGQARPRLQVSASLSHPLAWGFLATVGGLIAIALSGALVSLSAVLVWIGAALFIALALDPLVRWLERRGLSRALGITVVFLVFAVLLGGLLALAIPQAVVQIAQFATSVPTYITNLQDAPWFQSIVTALGQQNLTDTLLNQARTWLSDPANLLALGGGALSVGTGLVNGISGTLIVLVLTLYFLASLKSIMHTTVKLAPAYARERLSGYLDRITEAVGGYVSGMGILAICNAIFGFILLTALGVPFAALLALSALAITMIPMVGSVIFWLLATTVTLFTSWWAGLLFAGIYFAYMQIEAYLMTPRVMTKAVDIPGSLVLIGAMVGGTLLGLLGALVAVPVTASLLMVVREVVLPRQDAKRVQPDLL